MHFWGWAYNRLVDLGDIALAVAVFVLLPLSIFRSKRRFAGTALKFIGFIFLLNLWAYALAVIWKSWGLIGFSIGVIFTPLAAAIIAIVAATLHGDWMALLSIVVEILLTVGAWKGGDAIESRGERPSAGLPREAAQEL